MTPWSKVNRASNNWGPQATQIGPVAQLDRLIDRGEIPLRAALLQDIIWSQQDIVTNSIW